MNDDRTERPFEPPTPRVRRTDPVGAPRPSAPPAALAERFEVLGLLGCGGMGVVYRARDLRLGREVALKLLLDVTPEMEAMFRREARTLAALEHDHVVRLYDFGVVEDRPYLVMEYVRGSSLSMRLAEGRPTVAEAARTARDVLRGVAAAHRQGVVHRDLKPANVFLDENARAKVADFGLARSAAAPDLAPPVVPAGEGTSVTDGGIFGTPGYMAPEQGSGAAVGPAADVYAWGVMMHEMLTGRRLFIGEVFAMFAQQRQGAPAAPSLANPSVPHALDQLVTRCLLPDPQARPTAEEALAELQGWMDGVRDARRPRPGVELPVSPYKFLSHFEPADAPIFFGREAEVLEMAGLVESAGTRLAFVFGPCGVGKSSLLRAGLLPALDPDRFEPLVLSPGPDAARHVTDALAGRATSPGKTLVLVLDQLEEVFTQNPRGSTRPAELFRLVESLVESAAPVKLVLSYRTEFRGDFFPLEERLGRHARTVAVREISRAGLIEAVEGPSRLPSYNFAYADGLPERLAADILAGGDKSLPVLQIVCRQLYERMRAKGQVIIDAALYEGALGGTRGALDRYVEERLAGPEYAYRGAMARQLLKALTLKEEGGERFSRASDEDELLDFPDREGARLTLERLISDHLVIREASNGRRRVRLASEVICALVDGWSAEPDEVERAARILTRALRQWDEQGRRDDDLLQAGALALVERHLGALKDVSPAEQALVARSRAARTRRRVRTGVLALALACVTGGLAWAAFFRPGTVVLTTFPPGAQVTHAGQPVGETPLRWSARPGRYQLDVTKERYAPMTLEVHVPAGGEAAYQPILPYPFGSLSVDTVPAGATATVRRAAQGGIGPVVSVHRTPFTTELPEGAYMLALDAKGWVTQTFADVRVQPNREITRQSATLERDTGFVMVKTPWAGTEVTLSDAAGAQVFANVLPMKSPAELPVGQYKVRFTGPQHRAAETSVDVRRATTATLTAWVPIADPMWVYPPLAGQGGRTPDGAAPPPGGAGAVAPPVLGDLDELRGPDVVTGHQDGRLAAVAGASGRELWAVDLGSPVYTAAALSDLDGDTRPDVVAVTADGVVHARAGRTGAPLWSSFVGAPSRSTPVLADLDGDGVEDAVVGAQDGTLAALSGASGSILWKHRFPAPVRAAVAIADLDGDRALDLVAASDDGAVRALRGRDASRLWEFRAGAAVRGAPLLAQLDNRPGLEVVIGALDGQVRALAGATGAVLWARKCGPVEAPCASADLDGDGAADVLVPGLDHALRALSGYSGRELWKASTPTPLPFGVVIARLDGDAAPDVVVAAPEPFVRVYSGRDGRLLQSVPTAGPPLQSAPAVGDLNSSGMPDVVARGMFDTTVCLKLDAEAHDWAYQFADGAGPTGENQMPWLVAADLDGDADADVVLGAGDGRLLAFRGRDQRPLWTHEDRALLPLPPGVADLDGDGLTELICVSMKGEVYALAPRDGREAWRLDLHAQPGVPPAFTDLDGDGVPDLVFGVRGAVKAYSGKDRRLLWSADLGPDNPLTVVPGDVDRDGKPDLALTLMSRSVRVLDHRGVTRWAAPDAGHLQVCPHLPDLDGDGAADVAAITEEGALSALHGGTGRVLWRVENVAGRVRPVAGDLDGDGAADVVTATVPGPVMAFAGRTGKKLWQADAGAEVADLHLMDLDGDGKLDVFAQAMLGKIFGLSGQGAPAHFLDDVYLMGALPAVFVDPATFREHPRVLESAGRAAAHLPRTKGPDLALYSIRLSSTLVKSRLPWPIGFTRWGAEQDLTAGQRRFVMPPPVVPRRKPVSALWPWPVSARR